MPAYVFPAQNGQPMRAIVACDRRDDIGKVKIPLARLQQWQLTHGQLARWITAALGLRGKLEKGGASGTYKLRTLHGKERMGVLELDTDDPVCLTISGHSLPLNEAVFIENGEPAIDRAAILAMVDLPPLWKSSPSTAQREARKLQTQAMYESWQKEYRKLKRKNPKRSDQWCSLQIAKLEVAQGRDAETIRKQMKK